MRSACVWVTFSFAPATVPCLSLSSNRRPQPQEVDAGQLASRVQASLPMLMSRVRRAIMASVPSRRNVMRASVVRENQTTEKERKRAAEVSEYLSIRCTRMREGM